MADGEWATVISPSRLEGTVWTGLCPKCKRGNIGFVMEREVYRFDEIVFLGVCPACEHGFAVQVIDAPDDLPMGPRAAGGLGETEIRDLELGAKIR